MVVNPKEKTYGALKSRKKLRRLSSILNVSTECIDDANGLT